MEALLIIMATAFVCVCCFIVGVSVRQKVDSGEEVKMPNPVKAVQEHHEQKAAQREAQKEREKVETILANIDKYDGTAKGQEDVPRG